MKRLCPESECPSKDHQARIDPKVGRILRKGTYYRRSDGQHIPRFVCTACGTSFSSARSHSTYRQKKRQLNLKVCQLLYSGVSQRRAARLLKISRNTVARKKRFMTIRARKHHETFMQSLTKTPLGFIQFDDLETSEHTKCKPLSVALAVEPRTRKILGFEVSQMPARGPLSSVALKRYGPRADLRSDGWNALFAKLKPIVAPDARWLSDENPHYPKHLKAHHPEATHQTTPSRRARAQGLGELKKGGFDPLFALNHTCAMLRANLNRLFRKTWCTTKNRRGLIDHLTLYVWYHNSQLTREYPISGATSKEF